MESKAAPQRAKVLHRNPEFPSAPASGAKSDPSGAQLTFLGKTEVAKVACPTIALRGRPYFVAKLLENGVLEHHHKEQQFIIPIDSEVRFQVDRGTKISRQARLLINKPKRYASGQVEYTITQPLENDDDQLDAQILEGSELDADYLEMVEPDPEASEYLLEYRVHFGESGSFFVQIAYVDEIDASITRYTPP